MARFTLSHWLKLYFMMAYEFMYHVEGFALVNNDGNFNFNHIMTRDFSGWVPARNYFTIKIQQNWNSSLFILDFKYLNFINPDFMEQNLIKHNLSVGWLFWFGNEGYSLSNQMVSSFAFSQFEIVQRDEWLLMDISSPPSALWFFLFFLCKNENKRFLCARCVHAFSSYGFFDFLFLDDVRFVQNHPLQMQVLAHVYTYVRTQWSL